MRDRFSRLRRKYLSLGLGELAAVAAFAAAAFVLQQRLDSAGAGAALWFALVPLEFVLIQAGVYWLLARTWIVPGRMPLQLARIFRGLRIINPLVLLVGLAGVIANLPSTQMAAVVVIVVWAFGIAEYVNYYLVRLSYPWTQWASEIGRWRTPKLVKDMRAAG
ncbi:hypothetical protein [Brevibacterium zhoupengii]|uniref:hypothetical protein n=1 Tax=Brevibacterium zhoupengii TaxID=2898795 RepID=UPI001E386D8E|nr:hypothetical protein [Brevibacterium zhoupengii]